MSHGISVYGDADADYAIYKSSDSGVTFDNPLTGDDTTTEFKPNFVCYYTLGTSSSFESPNPSMDDYNISLSPVVNVTVNDADGDTMNISWLSNSSGSWQVFGTNNSVNNGTYHQIFSNATVNGQWWYWKVNVSDGTNYKVSNVFSFFTGYQSKIENTGSTNFKGLAL